MKKSFSILPVTAIESGTRVVSPRDSLPDKVTLSSPAIDVMTDLSRVAALTIGPNDSIDSAAERMKNNNVHLLLVLNNEREAIGVISVRDIRGERPVRFMNNLGVARADILVRDIMTPREKMQAMWLPDVAKASVGDIIETMKDTGRQHAIVVERTPDGLRIRGVFSSLRISRQLGVSLESGKIAVTFSELEKALAH